MPILPMDIRGLSKSFGKTAAVANVSLTVGPAELTGLVGPNGSGKTTLMRCATGLLRFDAGSVTILGHDLVSARSEVMTSLAFVPEVPAPFAALTPDEHLRFTARVHALSFGWETRRDAILERLDLAEKRSNLCSELSKGQRQKVHLAMAMLQDPAVLVLDEPLIGLDPKTQRVLKDWLRDRQSRGHAALVSSHSLAFVEELCSRIAIIEKGQILAVGTLLELRARARTAGAASLEDVFLRLTDSDEPMLHA